MAFVNPTWLALAGLVVALAAPARAQFQAPPNSLELDETGTLEGIQNNVLMFRDGEKEPWYLQLVAQTAVSIEGEADAAYLRPGQTVELIGEVGDDVTIQEPVAEIEVLDPKDRATIGLFAADDESANAKPLRNPEAGKYRIRGKLASVKGGELLIAAGRLKIGATLGEEVKVRLKLADVGLAKPGDTIKVKAWYFDNSKPNATLMRPGKALAEEINITLSEPPPADKRGR